MRAVVRALKLALVTAAVVLAAGCSSAPVGALTSTSNTITAQFQNTNGLYVGNPVSVLGMRIGKVVAIHPHATYSDVTLNVDKWVKIPRNAQAVTVSTSVLTDRHIELTPAYRDGPTLPDQSVISLDHTRTPVEFDGLMAMADKLSKALGTPGQGTGPVAGLLDTGSQIAAGNGNNLRQAMSELSRALQLGPDNGAATRQAITTVTGNLDTLTAAAGHNDQALREFGSGIATLSDILADQNLGAGSTGAQLNQIIIAVTDLLQRNRGNLQHLTTNATTLTTSLADYNDNIAEFLDTFPLVADNAYNAIDQKIGALRATISLDRFFLDGQMLKEACNLLALKDLGCATGTPRDMGPDFGIGHMLSAIAGVPPK
ncbi:MCE family protein [Nocardia sp. CA2R105]|uniref:MCE family protein n=1 Tax=Nocardia coffeae TaxID=2873381 RepID=UPI001CA78A6C|nr:MCE family protein [Nocardia coffeae]MBY8856585.1 MCE family protein [Nocardia coffeae]